MKYYRILLNGENFLIRLRGKKTIMGFYTTRCVEARDTESAELKAVEVLQNDEQLKSRVLNKSWQKQPRIYVEEMREIEEKDMEDIKGFTLYDMNEE